MQQVLSLAAEFALPAPRAVEDDDVGRLIESAAAE
jgi:hypothetical protein